jgi:DNA-binding transcriptional MocR family regulator
MTLLAGDVVVVESPTYFLMGPIFHDHRLRARAIASTSDGYFDVDALADQLSAGLRPRLVYIVPTHSNPRGATLPLAGEVIENNHSPLPLNPKP